MSGTRAREQLLKMRRCMAREEVGQSAANDAALSTEQATADVYTPNNISRAANNPPIPHDEGSREQLAGTGIIKYAESTLPHMWREMLM